MLMHSKWYSSVFTVQTFRAADCYWQLSVHCWSWGKTINVYILQLPNTGFWLHE